MVAYVSKLFVRSWVDELNLKMKNFSTLDYMAYLYMSYVNVYPFVMLSIGVTMIITILFHKSAKWPIKWILWLTVPMLPIILAASLGALANTFIFLFPLNEWLGLGIDESRASTTHDWHAVSMLYGSLGAIIFLGFYSFLQLRNKHVHKLNYSITKEIENRLLVCFYTGIFLPSAIYALTIPISKIDELAKIFN